MRRDDRDEWTAAQLRVVLKKFCTTCQSMVNPEGGKKVQKFRWMCAGCIKRRERKEFPT